MRNIMLIRDMVRREEVILTKEREAHYNFFGQEFNLIKFQEVLRKNGSDAIDQWEKLGFEPHFLPEVVISQNVSFPGLRVRPKDKYYEWANKGMIFRRQQDGSLVSDKKVFKLDGIAVLIDVRPKPQQKDIEQMFLEDNSLALFIAGLRKKGKIDGEYDYHHQRESFGVLFDEWERYVNPVLSELLGGGVSNIRFERIVEAIIIPQLYPDIPRRYDGNIWCWCEEYLKDDFARFFIDNSGVDVVYNPPNIRWSPQTARPLIVLK